MSRPLTHDQEADTTEPISRLARYVAVFSYRSRRRVIAGLFAQQTGRERRGPGARAVSAVRGGVLIGLRA